MNICSLCKRPFEHYDPLTGSIVDSGYFKLIGTMLTKYVPYSLSRHLMLLGSTRRLQKRNGAHITFPKPPSIKAIINGFLRKDGGWVVELVALSSSASTSSTMSRLVSTP